MLLTETRGCPRRRLSQRGEGPGRGGAESRRPLRYYNTHFIRSCNARPFLGAQRGGPAALAPATVPGRPTAPPPPASLSGAPTNHAVFFYSHASRSAAHQNHITPSCRPDPLPAKHPRPPPSPPASTGRHQRCLISGAAPFPAARPRRPLRTPTAGPGRPRAPPPARPSAAGAPRAAAGRPPTPTRMQRSTPPT